MRIACIVEGTTEYYCVPCIVARLGNIVIGVISTNGTFESWEKTIQTKVLPRVIAMAQKNPDKILVVLDREKRKLCCGKLANIAKEILEEKLHSKNHQCRIGMVISDPRFESTIFSDYESVDGLRILKHGITAAFGPTTDGVNVLAHVKAALRPGASYDKVIHGPALAQRLPLNDPKVIGRSKALRKLIKEATESS